MKHIHTATLITLALLLALASCTPFLQYEGDCEVTYRLRFRYDYNMKRADAFGHEVKSVHVWAFDSLGTLAWSTVESGDQLSADGYSIVMPLNPGSYKIVAWCGADNNPGDEDFSIGASTLQDLAASSLSEKDLSCRLSRQHTTAGTAFSDRDLHPLFFGSINTVLPDLGTEGGEHTVTVPLIKDTNRLRIVLQHLSGQDVNIDDFDFSITAANGQMLADNSLAPDETITYTPWGRFAGTAGVEINDSRVSTLDSQQPIIDSLQSTRAITNVAIARADFTLPRLMMEQRKDVMLTITRHSDGDTVARIPVIDYALLVKDLDSKGNTIPDQEYLDRQDSYSMVFFLDENNQWLAAQVIINSWRVVLHNYDI